MSNKQNITSAKEKANKQAQIKQKKDFLETVKKKLKQDFIGIDKQIDNIFSLIEVWYTLPEVLKRPVIINLWGMTGSGKTDLVRKLVKYLGMSDNFLEIQMSFTDNSEDGYKTIHGEIINAGIYPENQSVILFDEFQRFRTKDSFGNDVPNLPYQDIWSILSDGSVLETKEDKSQIETQKWSYLYNEERKTAHEENEKKNGKKIPHFKYKITHRNAKFFKEMLNIRKSIEEIMMTDPQDILKLIDEKINNKDYQNLKYERALIFVCGNLDEAFADAILVEENDIDADLIHERSQKINIFDIKSALNIRFRPEQIARLGNNHVIYPSLSKNAYKKIIKMKLDEMAKNISKEMGLKSIRFDSSVESAIYKNSVFPTQGVRPVFSTISSIENIFPKISYVASCNNQNIQGEQVKVSYVDKNFVVQINDSKMEIEHEFDIQDVINSTSANKAEQYRVISVHEAGHLIGSFLFQGKVPDMATIKSDTTGGYVMVPEEDSFLTCDAIDRRCKTIVAGTIAEEIVFGERSAGASDDLRKASHMLSFKYRSGIKNFLSTTLLGETKMVTVVEKQNQYDEEVKKDIEQIVKETREVLIKNKEMLAYFSKLLFDNRTLNKEQMEDHLNKFQDGKYKHLLKKKSKVVDCFDKFCNQSKK